MKSERLSIVENKVKKLINNKEIIDVIVFGSFAKGKEDYNDIDIAIISQEEVDFKEEGIHLSKLKPIDFFITPSSITNTLIREGYSLKHKKEFSESWNFKSKILFNYDLKNLKNTSKVRIVNLLRGNKNNKGMVDIYKGVWLSNGVFTINIENEYLFDSFFKENNINFTKSYILIH